MYGKTIAVNLAGLSMVKNEADVIESFVRHNLNYLDRLFIVLQPSQDGTLEILSALAAEGLALEVVHNDDAFRQGEILTESAKAILAEGDFHAIVVLDADEFIKTPDSALLRKALSAVPADMCACWSWQSYVPTDLEDSPDIALPARVTHRRAQEVQDVFKVILTRSFLQDGLYIAVGSHRIFEEEGGSSVMPNIGRIRGSSLAHFPVRSVGQLQRKIANGMKVLNRDYDDPHTCYHWRMIDQLLKERDLDLELVQLIASDYQFQEGIINSGILPKLIEDPLPVNYSLRYSQLQVELS